MQNNDNTNDQKAKQERREKLQNVLIAVVLSVSLIIVVKYISDYYYFDQIQAQITEKETKLTGLRQQNQHSLEIKTNFQKLEADSAQVEKDYEQLSPLIPQDEEVQSILNDIYKAAVERGLRVTLFSQSEKVVHQGALNEVPCKASVLGAPDAINRYLVDFTRFKRILQLHKVRVTEEKDPKYVGNFNAEILFSAYSSPKLEKGKVN